MDKDLENILKKAQKATSVKKEPERKPYVHVPCKPYDHLVFTKVTSFSGFHVIPFLLVIPIALCVGFLFPGFAYVTVLTLLIYAGLLGIYSLINFVRFRMFIGWQEKLPFALKGWNEMIATKKNVLRSLLEPYNADGGVQGSK